MKTLEKELRAEAYSNLRRKYDNGSLNYPRLTKAEIKSKFQRKFQHLPESGTGRNSKIGISQLQDFVRELAIQKKMPEELESVEKAFYRKVKNCKS